MKTLDEFKDFYEKSLSVELQALEQKRKGLIKRLIIAWAVIAAIALIILSALGADMFAALPVVMFVVVGCIILSAVVTGILNRSYVTEFKKLVIGKIVKFIDENLQYVPRGYIPARVFVASEIFKSKPNRYRGDDLVRGKIGATEVEFCELHAEYESGGKNRSRRTIFRGLFFIADFNKDFTCRVIVLPDVAENLLGGFGKLLQSWNPARDQLIKLEDPEFEKYFVVYGDDQVQARYILSTSLMARIVDFRKKTGKRLYLSFLASKVFVAIPYNRNLFEPRLFRSLLDFELVRQYFEDLQLATGIVDELNLNTRIWSKQ